MHPSMSHGVCTYARTYTHIHAHYTNIHTLQTTPHAHSTHSDYMYAHMHAHVIVGLTLQAIFECLVIFTANPQRGIRVYACHMCVGCVLVSISVYVCVVLSVVYVYAYMCVYVCGYFCE